MIYRLNTYPAQYLQDFSIILAALLRKELVTSTED